MYIRVGFGRRIEIKDRLYVGHVYTSRRHVRTDQTIRLSDSESLHGGGAVLLIHFPVEKRGFYALGTQRAMHAFRAEARITEYYVSAIPALRNDRLQTLHPQAVGHDRVVLPHVGSALRGGSFHSYGRAHHGGAKSVDLVGQRRGKQQILPVCVYLRYYLAHVVQKSHFEHHVAFVQHERTERLDTQGLSFHMIEYPADSAYNDMGLLAQSV